MKKIVLFLCLILFKNSLYAKEYTFNEVIIEYLNNNKTLKALKNQMEAKEFLIKKSESLKYPSLDLDLSYNILNTEPKIKTSQGNLPASEDKYLKGQLLLSYIIYDFGKRDSIIKQSLIDKRLIDLYIKKEINDQIFNIGKMFYEAISLSKMKEVYEEELSALKEHKKRIDAFYEEGLVTRNEVLQIDAEISNTKQKIIKTENDFSNIIKSLKLITSISEDASLIDALVIDESAMESISTEKRPEVLIAKELISIKEQQLKLVDSDYYPKLYVGTGVNYEQNKYRVDDYSYFLTLGIKVNIFSGKSTTYEKQAILKEIEEQREKFSFVNDIVNTDFEQAKNDYNTSKEKIKVAEDSISQAKENLKIQQGKYEEHLIPATDLIDATLLLTRAKLNYLLALYENKVAFIRALWAKGDLLSTFGGKNE